jgi:excisionase family DNA binding protein
LLWLNRFVMKKQSDKTEQELTQLNLLTLALLAKLLGIHERSLMRLIDRGEGPPRLKLGRRVLFRRESVEKWLLACERAERRLQRGNRSDGAEERV